MNNKTFSKRKKEHIELALMPQNEADSCNNLHTIELIHEAIPDLDFSNIDINNNILGSNRPPFFVSSMTAGHKDATKINISIAKACQEMNWIMGIGSQRKQLTDPDAKKELLNIRKEAPKATIFGNIGLSQLIETKVSSIKEILEPLDAQGLFIHTNPLQECIQPEGTPRFKGGLKAIENLCNNLEIPVILKETGCGFSFETLQKLDSLGLYAVELSGLGGTHWGRIEGYRAHQDPIRQKASLTFKNWGISTLDSLLNGIAVSPDYQLWASGGVRSGLDAAKLIAVGAQMVGFAKPILIATLEGYDALINFMKQVHFEYQVALFCTGQNNTKSFQENKIWVKK